MQEQNSSIIIAELHSHIFEDREARRKKLNNNAPKPAKLRPMRVEMYCKVTRCRYEILHQVRNDVLV